MRIRELRLAIPGMTQQKLADIVGVDRSAVTRWEAKGGKPLSNRPSADKLPLICKALKCKSINDLYEPEELSIMAKTKGR